MAALTAAAALFLSVVGSSLISVASADTATLTLSGTPATGNNTYGVSLVVPMGDPVPSQSVVVTGGGSGPCDASLSGSSDATTYTGSCTIDNEDAGDTVTATYTGDSNYTVSQSNSITVEKANQPTALAVTSTSGTFGTALTLTSSGGNGTGAVTYAATTPGSAGCSVSGTQLSATSSGTCGGTATKDEDSNYNAASSQETTITISTGAQAALTITSVTGTYNTSLTLVTSGGSGTGAVSYAVSDGTATGCSVTAGALSETSAGTCIVTATKAASGSYTSASSPATTITLALATQAALTITSVTGTYNTALTLTTSGGSDGVTVTYVVTTAGTAVCSVTGAVLSETSAGTCTVTATMPANADYNAVSSTATTITIATATQAALTITSVTGAYNTPITLTTSGGSDSGAVSYVVSDAGTAGCSVTGSVLIATTAGTCTVTAAMAANTDYSAVSSTATTITIGKIDQAPLTITPTSSTYNAALALGVSGGSDNGAVTFALNDAGTANCSISSSVLSATTVGTCTVTATMAGSADYNAVSSAATTITIEKTAQAALTITSTSGVLSSPLPLAVSGGSDSGAVTYAIDSAGSANCSIANGALSATSVGTCTVTATMAGNGDYNAVSSSATTITLVKTGQAPTISSKGGADFTALALGSFTFNLSGTPSPIVTTKAALPAGLTLTNNGNGTETISGFTALFALGTHRVTLLASNGIGSPAKRTLDIVVGFAPVLVTSPTTTFTSGHQNSFSVKSLAYPADSLSESGALPSGVSFAPNRDGTATLSGSPAANAVGAYNFSIAARNSFGTFSQSFKLLVGAVPAFSSADAATFPIGVASVFHVAAAGSPQPTITERGTLPKGMRFVGGRGTATLSGTPDRGTSGSYPVTFTAGSGSGLTASQGFTLVVGASASFKSAGTTTFTVGDATVFIVAATGKPTPPVTEHGALPAGVRFQGGSGTGILSGTPAKGTKGTYRVTLLASGASQTFTLIVTG
jgi:large repetitive protein